MHRVQWYHGDRPVEDEQPQRQHRGGVHLATHVEQPPDVFPVLRRVADAIQVDGAHAHAAAQQHLVKRSACPEVLRGLRPVGHQRKDLPPAAVGELGELGPDGVEPEYLGDRDRGLFGRLIGGELRYQGRDRVTAPLHLLLPLQELGLLPGHQIAERDVRADEAYRPGILPHRPDQGQPGQLVECVMHVVLRLAEMVRDLRDTSGRLIEQGKVDSFDPAVYAERLKHPRAPGSSFI